MANSNLNGIGGKAAVSNDPIARAQSSCDQFIDAFLHARRSGRDTLERFFSNDLDPLLNTLEESLEPVPSEHCAYERSILAACDGDWESAERYLGLAAKRANISEILRITPEEFLGRWVFWFTLNGPKEFGWPQLAAAFDKRIQSSAAILWLTGLSEFKKGKREVALDSFEQSLNADNRFWLSAKAIAEIFVGTRTWRTARGYYLQALESASGPLEKADIHFWIGLCNERLKDLRAANNSYRACLELDQGYEFAQNNIGWNLMRLREYAEAEKILRDAIDRGVDGRAPSRNLAELFRRTKRFNEAIALLQQDMIRGKLSKYSVKQIARIQGQIARQSDSDDDESFDDDSSVGATGSESSFASNGDCASGMAELDETELGSGIAHSAVSTRPAARLHREDALEGQIEQQILCDGNAFGRHLIMYESPSGKYGRQFAIPEIGRIDILAVDSDTGEFVVIELKRDKGDDEVVGQTCRYLGWIRENLAGQRPVVGIICVRKSTERLRLAARQIPGLLVFEFSLTISQQ